MALDDGTMARAAVPSGASTGAFEAVELRDGDGTATAARASSEAVAAVDGRDRPRGRSAIDASEQRLIDQAMIDLDGTPNKSRARRQRHPRRLAGRGPRRGRIGRPAAVPLPRRAERARPAGADDEHPQRRRARRHRRRHPGVHDRPDRAPTTSPRRCAWGAEVYHSLKSVLKEQGLATGLGDEGGFAPDLPSNRAALDLIAEAIEAAGLSARRGHRAGPGRGRHRVLHGRGVLVRGCGQTVGRRWPTYYAELRRRLPAGLDRGPAGRGRLGGLDAS